MNKIKTIKVMKIPLSDTRKEDLRNHPLYRKAREYAEHLLSKEGGNDV